MMTEMLGCCGLDCARCRAYIATRNKDVKLAAELAKLWSISDDRNYKVDDIWCDGCHSDRLHGFCVSCPPRLCAKEKGLTNCALCGDYPCEKLETLYGFWVESSPAEARANLWRIRSTSRA